MWRLQKHCQHLFCLPGLLFPLFIVCISSSLLCLTWLCCELAVNDTIWADYNTLWDLMPACYSSMYVPVQCVCICVCTVGLSALAWAFSWGETLQGASFFHKHHLSTTGSPASKHLAQEPSRLLTLYVSHTHTRAHAHTHTHTHTNTIQQCQSRR